LAHLTAAQIEQYRAGQAAPAELLMLDDHLAVCDECRASLAAQVPVRDVLEWAAGLARYREGDQALASSARPNVSAMARRQWLWISAAAAAVIALTILGWQTMRSRMAAPVEVANNQPPADKYRVLLRDGGGNIVLRDDGTLSVPVAVGETEKPLIAEALRTGALPLAAPPSDLAIRPGTLRGPSSAPSFAPLAPLGTVVLSDQPAFQWEPLERAQSYRVQVFDSDYREVASSGALKVTEWRPERPLARGKLYQWQVSAVRGGETVRSPVPPAPEARFRIVDGETAGRIAAAQPSHLAAAILCAQAGLRDEARQELEQVRAANPDAEIVKKLLASLPAASSK
jgi:hypothetical protein